MDIYANNEDNTIWSLSIFCSICLKIKWKTFSKLLPHKCKRKYNIICAILRSLATLFSDHRPVSQLKLYP